MKDEFTRAEPRGDDSSEAKAQKRRVPTAKSPSKPPENVVALTHPDKVMFPDAGLTKRDVAAYYERVAPRLLPFLKDRPVTLERMPEGLAGPGAPHFWQ